MEQYITWTGTTQCPTVQTHTTQWMQEDPASMSRWHRTVHIPWLVDSYDTHKGKRWLNSNPQTTGQNFCNAEFLIVSFLFYNYLTCLFASMYSAIVSSLLIILFSSSALCLLPIACLTSLMIHDGMLVVSCLINWDVSSACIIDSVLENFKS